MVNFFIGFLVVLGLHTAPNPSEPYVAVLEEMRREFPERQVVLTTTLARPSCSPHCDGPASPTAHPEQLLGALREMRLIVGSCTPEPRTIGCGAGREVWSADRMVVSLGPVEWVDDAAGVSAVVQWREEYRGRGIDSVRGYRYRLVRDGDGRWRVCSATLAWTA